MENKKIELQDQELNNVTGGVCQVYPKGEMPGGHCKCGGMLLFYAWQVPNTKGVSVCDTCGLKWSFENA